MGKKALKHARKPHKTSVSEKLSGSSDGTGGRGVFMFMELKFYCIMNSRTHVPIWVQTAYLLHPR
jgi:hypothetical protein